MNSRSVGADVNLPRAADACLRVLVHLQPMGDPAGQPAHGKQHREHRHGNADRPIDHAGVEIDVRVQLPLDEVLIVQGDFFELLGDIEDRIVDMPLRQKLVARGLDNRARGSKFL